MVLSISRQPTKSYTASILRREQHDVTHLFKFAWGSDVEDVPARGFEHGIFPSLGSHRGVDGILLLLLLLRLICPASLFSAHEKPMWWGIEAWRTGSSAHR